MDSKLYLKPIELLDIGIDKLTKIPIPILNNNIITISNTENGIPSDSFIIKFNAAYSDQTLNMTVFSDYDIDLYFDFGDGIIDSWGVTETGQFIQHTFPSALTYTVTATGWLDRIKTLIISPSGTTGAVTSAYLGNLKKLSYLDLADNRLINIDLSKLIYLNNINLFNNYLTNDVIDDLYINADTFLTFNGNINTLGTNNGIPSIYSSASRNNLTVYKEWVLSYNT
jgi:hypothetical protein